MRQYLLPDDGQFYRVNMHSHSSLSDGVQSPEALKEAYLAMGYAAIAFTEHGRLHDLSYLTDERFVALLSYEVDLIPRYEPPFVYYDGKHHGFNHAETIHMNLYARDPDKAETLDIEKIRAFSVENANAVIRAANEAGYLVVYNHPNWSFNTAETYCRLKGLRGLEINNGASNRSSDCDYTPLVYDHMLRAGQRLICVGGDDNHNTPHFGKAWTMVKAKALTHAALIEAIDAGDCYASDGPEIEALWLEDGVVHIKCSPAVGVYLTTAGRRISRALEEEVGHPITEAALKITPDDIYFRITVRDERGHHANTRAYFLDELA